MRLAPAAQPATRASSVEPSRAWILGLVVDADGSVTAPPAPDVEWPAPAPEDGHRPPGAAPAPPVPDQILPQDGPSVRT
jgi:hypothetical protein